MKIEEEREKDSKNKIENLNSNLKRNLKNEIENSNLNSNKINALIILINNFISINSLIIIEKSLIFDSFTIKYVILKDINISIKNVIMKNIFISHRVLRFNREIYNEINKKRKFKSE